MLDVLWIQGRVAVAGRNGIQKLWDLADRWFPAWTPKDRLSEREIVRRAAQRSLRALGVARARDIDRHFTAGRYPGLPEVLTRLESEGTIERVRVVDDGSEWPGPWFVHGDDVPLLERMRDGWAPRTTLLSPFDNLIIDRDRAELLFGVRLRMEIHVPKSQRRYGYYSLPILHEVPCEEFRIGEFKVACALVCHPGPTVAYRITAPGGVMTYMPDHEPALGARVFPLSPDWTSGYALAAGADLLIHDAQYSREEYEARVGWGHSSLSQTLAFARLGLPRGTERCRHAARLPRRGAPAGCSRMV